VSETLWIPMMQLPSLQAATILPQTTKLATPTLLMTVKGVTRDLFVHLVPEMDPGLTTGPVAGDNQGLDQAKAQRRGIMLAEEAELDRPKNSDLITVALLIRSQAK